MKKSSSLQKSRAEFTPCEKTGIDPVALANTIIDAGKRRVILTEIALETNCNDFDLMNLTRDLTLPQLKELLEVCQSKRNEKPQSKKLKSSSR